MFFYNISDLENRKAFRIEQILRPTFFVFRCQLRKIAKFGWKIYIFVLILVIFLLEIIWLKFKVNDEVKSNSLVLYVK